ncbi:hypothetical protein BC830DRAFT_1087895 [Chytriomyces sp. MP71]|nr:hypothetical protein BC830DRAFT_1087895 [Chytriomyces sp. MP71]
MSVAAKTMLVYGSTGRTGLLVVNKALKEGWRVGAFARNPAKLPQVLRDDSRVTIIQGDLSDAAAVSAAVKSLKPHAIVDASSSIPLGHAKGVAPNSADRAGLTKATYETLKSESRLEECIFLIVGGQLFAEPGGTINSWSVAALAWFLKNVAMPAAARDVDALLGWMFNESDPAFRFVYARMGQVILVSLSLCHLDPP